MGPSGAGKSSFLSIITSKLSSYSGNFKVKGRVTLVSKFLDNTQWRKVHWIIIHLDRILCAPRWFTDGVLDSGRYTLIYQFQKLYLFKQDWNFLNFQTSIVRNVWIKFWKCWICTRSEIRMWVADKENPSPGVRRNVW